MYKFGHNSLNKLKGVHPDLVHLCMLVIEKSKFDFGITDGLRTQETQEKYLKEGKSKTLDSKHLIQSDGYSHAIDFAVYLNGRITWDIAYYRPVIQTFFTTAIQEKIFIKAGGLWRTFVDGPHIELDSNFYLVKK